MPLKNKAKIKVAPPQALPFTDGHFIPQTQLNGVIVSQSSQTIGLSKHITGQLAAGATRLTSANLNRYNSNLLNSRVIHEDTRLASTLGLAQTVPTEG